ncbi:glycosyltransferase family 4 protein [Bradyrhizobium erythrophlei]|uniref:glycosyltransferase family 4 protein n=1 Tax=Bradyrhizobium erythrophlei TaxID=1437360 RepID=UPI0035EF51FF
MRVLHLTTEFPPVIYGGLGTATGGLVKALAKSGVETAVLLFGPTSGSSYGQFRPLASAVARKRRRRAYGVTIFEVSWFLDPATIAAIAAKWRPDILHLHSFWIWPIAEHLRRVLGVPLVYTVHSLDRAEYEIGAGPPQCIGQWDVQQAVIYGADRVVSLTNSERDLLEEYCPGVDQRIRVVGNGIEDVEPVRRAKRGDRDAPVVLFSGRFVDRKGIWELIKAIEIVLNEAPQVKFVLAGGHRGCPGSQMEAWLLPERLHRFRPNIQFTGWLTPGQLNAWYRAADILVVPSWYEPFGMVVLEGMINGLAVAASAIGGPAEILDHGKTGLLFPARDADALALAILELSRDRNLRVRLAAAGAAAVREAWLWPKVVEKMLLVYDDAISNQAGHRVAPATAWCRERPTQSSWASVRSPR